MTNETRRGTTLVAVMAIVATLAILSLAILTKGFNYMAERRSVQEELSARYVAEAALADAVMDLRYGGDGNVASEKAPVVYAGARYWVEATDLGGNVTSLVATGVDGLGGARIRLVVGPSVTSSLSSYAAFGDEGMSMASNASIDSYDSSLGTYASQATNGEGADKYALESGSMGSNTSLDLAGNAQVHGDAIPGPSGTVTVGSNADVSGSTAPAPDTIPLEPIVVPPIAPSGALAVPDGGTTVLASGDHHYTSLDVGSGATLQIIGPARVVFGSVELISTAELLVDGSMGSVDIYVERDFILSSNTRMAPISRLPKELRLHLNTDNIDDVHVLKLDSNAEFYGTMYAPNAHVTIDSNFALFGSLVAKRLTLDSNSRIHFDLELLKAASASAVSISFDTLCWLELPFSVRTSKQLSAY